MATTAVAMMTMIVSRIASRVGTRTRAGTRATMPSHSDLLLNGIMHMDVFIFRSSCLCLTF